MGLNLQLIWRTMTGGARRPRCAQRSPVRPRLENLEDRTLLSQTEVFPAPRRENVISQRIQYLADPVVRISDRDGIALFSPATGWNAAAGWGSIGGQGTFTAKDSQRGLTVVQADFNGDGVLDPVAISSSPVINVFSAVLLLSGEDGIGTSFRLFAAPAQAQYFFGAAGDFNGDGKLDLALLSRVSGQPSQVNVQLFLGSGGGDFFSEVNLKVGQGVMSATVGSFSGTSSLTVSDFNGDGAIDVRLARIASTGTTLEVLLSSAADSFQASKQLWAPPGAYSLQMIGGEMVISYPGQTPTPVIQEPPPASSEPSEVDETEAETPVEPLEPVDEPPVQPVVIQTSVEGTGLAVEIAIDSNVLPAAGAVYDQTFWVQIVSAREVTFNDADGHSASGSTADAQGTGLGQLDSVAKGAAPVSVTAGEDSGKSRSSLAHEGNLEILCEGHLGFFDRGESRLALDQNLALPVGSWQSSTAAPIADEVCAGDAAAPLWQPALRLENRAGSLLVGLDDDVLAPVLLRPSDAGADADSSDLSALEVGQALLQAMIVVKLTPGGSGPDNRGVPGVVAPNDSLLRIAELVKDSSQFLTRLVRNFYQRFLGRDAENGEEQGWVQMLLGGEREEAVLSAFLSTREFGQHADALIETGTPDEKYLQSLYILVLDRTPSAAELGAWLQNPAGVDRQQAALALVSSNEFRVQQIEDMYRDSLQRDPPGQDAAHWAATPFGLRDIRQFFATHPEWFQA